MNPSGRTFFCDANAGMAVLPEVLDEFVRVERDTPGNPASAHTPGRRARGVLERARERTATALQLRPVDVVFTSGGTEGANLAVRGLGDVARPAVLGPAEHPAVREAAGVRGFVEWSVDGVGRTLVTAPEVAVGVICLVHAQSELGTLQPVDEAIVLGSRLDVPVFVDAAQTLGRVALPAARDSYVVALSPHKAGGMRGHGVLAGPQLTSRLAPILRGGAQEFGVRPGKQSPALAAANALAIERAIARQVEHADAMLRARNAFLDGIRAGRARFRVLTPLACSVPNTVMLCFDDIDGRNLLPALDLAGVHASHGSACSSGSPTPPKILKSIGLSDEHARASVRFSFPAIDDDRMHLEAGRRVADTVARLAQKM